MPRVTQEKLIGNLQYLNSALSDHAADLPHLQPAREQFEATLDRMIETGKRQADLTAQKQVASEELQALMSQASRQGTSLRLAIKAHYGIRSQMLPAFGMQPFRSRKPAPAPAPAPPAPAPESPAPDIE